MKINKKFSESSKRWLIRQQKDVYVKKARGEGYRSRAFFKLQEIDEKFNLVAKYDKVIDLGASPGGWSQYISLKKRAGTKIVALDLLDFTPIAGVEFFLGDFEDPEIQKKVYTYLEGAAGLIISDMAPMTIGHAKTDHLKIMRLVEEAFEFSKTMLTKGGAFVAKIFQGGEEKAFVENLRTHFEKVCFFKPKASRSMSVEIYIVAMGFKDEI